MKKKKPSSLLPLIVVPLLIGALGIGLYTYLTRPRPRTETQTVAVRPVAQQLQEQGVVTSSEKATLHFQTGGKLTYLLKEGAPVAQGQAVARLDTYVLQKQLAASLNTYRATRDAFDQQRVSGQNDTLKGQQRFLLDTQTKGVFPNSQEDPILNDIIARLYDESQATLDNSVINVEIANYAIQLASLTSPVTGVVTHEDVTTPYVNITPTTSFVVENPDALVFHTYVPDQDIYFISEGSAAQIQIDGSPTPLSGTVTKIYPGKETLADGRSVYRVDVESPELVKYAKLDQTGTVLIDSSVQENTVLAPIWAVVGHSKIWVMENGKAQLKTVRTGRTYGTQIEVLSGLSSQDEIIIDPQAVVEQK